MVGSVGRPDKCNQVTNTAPAAKGAEYQHKNDREHKAEKNSSRVGKDGLKACGCDGP